jgi:hypothetical protein
MAFREQKFNATLNLKTGTWLVHAVCRVLNALTKEETLEVVLTRIKRKIHEWSVKCSNGQTPEVIYHAHSKFLVQP